MAEFSATGYTRESVKRAPFATLLLLSSSLALEHANFLDRISHVWLSRPERSLRLHPIWDGMFASSELFLSRALRTGLLAEQSWGS